MSQGNPLFRTIDELSDFQDAPDSSGADDCQTDEQKEDENNKPGDIMFAHTVVNPCAVMVVLLDAIVADVAVVAPLGSCSATLKANSFGVVRAYNLFF